VLIDNFPYKRFAKILIGWVSFKHGHETARHVRHTSSISIVKIGCYKIYRDIPRIPINLAAPLDLKGTLVLHSCDALQIWAWMIRSLRDRY
jgi:hypothetical protein